jgi:L-asparaginase
MQPKISLKTVVLGTGGTIAGLSVDASNPINYKASQLGLTDILRKADIATDLLDMQDVAQIDSKDMGPRVWRPLLEAVVGAQQRPDVQAVVITHGTDTIEETAFLLDVMGPWPKPVVLTCAMQPADAPSADGPGNLRDALLLAQHSAFEGVAVVCAGTAHHPSHLQKIRTDQNDAFSSGLSQPLAQIQLAQWVFSEDKGLAFCAAQYGQRPSMQHLLNTTDWPRVEWLTNHADADGNIVLDLLATASTARRPLRGLVVAATGSGTVSSGLEAALLQAKAAGLAVWVSSRCVWGEAKFFEHKPWGIATHLNPAKAMMALRLSLMAEQR